MPSEPEAPTVSTTLAEEWAAQHADLVEAYAAMLEREGLPLERYRSF